MKSSLYQNILLIFGILFSACITILVFFLIKNSGKISSSNQINYPSISNTKITFDANKIPDKKIRDNIKSIKKISVILSAYTNDPTKFPINSTSPNGSYEYNIVFDIGKIDLFIAPAANLSANTQLFQTIITRLIIASSMQKIEKVITIGDLFDKQTSEDHIAYLNKILSDNNLNKINIVSY